MSATLLNEYGMVRYVCVCVCVKDYGRVLAERTEQVHDVLQYGRDAATVTLARTNRRSFTPADRHPPLTDRREYIGIFADRVSEQSKEFGRVRPSLLRFVLALF